MSTQPKTKLAPTEWQPSDAAELYRIPSWGDPFFFVNEKGHMAVRALDEQGTTMDVVDVVNELRRRGVQFPVLLRFQDVLRAQVRRVNEAFRSAIAESSYGNVYRGIYPIKVNQLHEVVDELLDAGRPYGMGLECGSKAELIAVPAAHRRRDAARLQRRQGPDDVVLDDRRPEARPEHRARHGEVLGVHRRQGSRVLDGVHVAARRARAARDARRRPLGRVVGHELEVRLERGRAHAHGQRARGERPAVEARCCLHCHIGSQIADIQVLKEATKEVTQIYAQLVKRGIALKYLDMGGGLGVNYGKGHLEDDAGINYALEEYANAVVFSVKEVCDANDVPTPTLVTGERPRIDRASFRAGCAGARRSTRRTTRLRNSRCPKTQPSRCTR